MPEHIYLESKRVAVTYEIILSLVYAEWMCVEVFSNIESQIAGQAVVETRGSWEWISETKTGNKEIK